MESILDWLVLTLLLINVVFCVMIFSKKNLNNKNFRLTFSILASLLAILQSIETQMGFSDFGLLPAYFLLVSSFNFVSCLFDIEFV